ncbi:MAG: trigger factor [Bacteroidia bacterium]|jgi:trigger factor|nr:trigger factor [Bacteroidia bacterium]
MNISKEHIDELNAVVKVKIGPDDYTDRVEKTLRNYQKQVSMPGFRPGKVPASLVKKMYGKSVLAEELNKILSDELYKYIRTEELDVLGNPLPQPQNDNVDIETQSEFEFSFDMALAPKFDLKLGSDMQFTEYKVAIDDKLIDGYVSDLTRRYGSIAPSESAQSGDLIYGTFVELDANGEILPGGIFKSSTMFLDNPVRDEHKALEGAKVDDKIILTASQIDSDTTALAQKLGIEPQAAEGLNSSFQFTVTQVSRLQPAELNQEFFDKIYGPGAVTSEEEFRARIATELSGMFSNDTEKRLQNDIASELIDRTNLTLPDAFLKRWLLTANEKPITPEQVDAEYDMYARQLRWQLIENKIIKDNNIQVSAEEATEHVKELLRENYRKYGMNPDEVPDAELTANAQRLLGKEEEARKVFENLYQQKLMTLYRTSCSITSKEVSYDDFLAGVK